MKNRNIILDKKSFGYLNQILNSKLHDRDVVTLESMRKLSLEMKNAKIVEDGFLPDNVIRINSKITVMIDGNRKVTIQIVSPAEKDIESNKISILTPMGLALLGYSKGDIVSWNFPNGERKIEILDVIQIPDLEQRRVVA